MKNRKLIEMLSKQDWNADIKMNIGLPAHTGDNILSITSTTKKEKPIITLNAFSLYEKKGESE